MALVEVTACKRRDLRLPHQQLAGRQEQRVPNRLRAHAASEQFQATFSHASWSLFAAKRREQLKRGRVVGLAVAPVGREFLRQFQVALPRPFGGQVARRARPCAVQQRIGQRTQRPARRAPSRSPPASANCWPRRSPCGRSSGNRARRSGTTARTLRRAPAARASAAAAASAGASSQRSIASMNALAGLVGRRHASISSTAPIVQLPSRIVLRLRRLEVVDRPEDRQPAVLVGRGEAGDVRRVHHQHRVKLEAHARPRLHVAHAGQEQRGHDLAIRRARV